MVSVTASHQSCPGSNPAATSKKLKNLISIMLFIYYIGRKLSSAAASGGHFAESETVPHRKPYDWLQNLVTTKQSR